MSLTFLPVTPALYAEMTRRIHEGGDQSAFRIIEGMEVIVMEGVALRVETPDVAAPETFTQEELEQEAERIESLMPHAPSIAMLRFAAGLVAKVEQLHAISASIGWADAPELFEAVDELWTLATRRQP